MRAEEVAAPGSVPVELRVSDELEDCWNEGGLPMIVNFPGH